MDEVCGAPSTYGENGQEWTYHCTAPADHAPGEHRYVLDEGQTPPPDGSF